MGKNLQYANNIQDIIDINYGLFSYIVFFIRFNTNRRLSHFWIALISYHTSSSFFSYYKFNVLLDALFSGFKYNSFDVSKILDGKQIFFFKRITMHFKLDFLVILIFFLAIVGFQR